MEFDWTPRTPREVVFGNEIRKLRGERYDLMVSEMPSFDAKRLPLAVSASARFDPSLDAVHQLVRVYSPEDKHFQLGYYTEASLFCLSATFDVAAELHKQVIYELGKELSKRGR